MSADPAEWSPSGRPAARTSDPAERPAGGRGRRTGRGCRPSGPRWACGRWPADAVAGLRAAVRAGALTAPACAPGARSGSLWWLCARIRSVALSVLGPKILGNATNLIFAGFIGSQIPAGVTKAEVVAAPAGAPATTTQANLLERDERDTRATASTSPRSAGCCCSSLLIYVGLASLCVLQGRLINDDRAARRVPAARAGRGKLTRLPLSYFDRQPRGEMLSRVTNDIDNIAQTLQQTLSQLVTSLLTIVGVLADDVLDLLAARADRAGHRAGLDPASRCGSASGPSRSSSAVATTGKLNGHIEEMFTGHSLVKVFGRQEEVDGDVHRAQREAVPGQLPGPVHLRARSSRR